MRTEMVLSWPASPALNENAAEAPARKLPFSLLVRRCSSEVPSRPVIVMYTSPSNGSELAEVVTWT